jgi:hypothetical protein
VRHGVSPAEWIFAVGAEGGSVMDVDRFDRLARFVGARPSRRAVLRAAVGSWVGGGLALTGGRLAAAQDPSCSLPCQTPDLTRCPTPQGCICVYLDRDNDNCGACGSHCPDGHSCLGGRCMCYRGNGIFEEPCNGSCYVDFRHDPANCGSCGHACRLGEFCVSGSCSCGGSRCLPCEMCEGGTCVPVVCPSCQVCADDLCVADPTQDGTICGFDQICCGGACVSMMEIPNCGACGQDCRAGWVPNTRFACTGGACEYTCLGGWGDCDGRPENGCETEIALDHAHCGACGNACAPGQECRWLQGLDCCTPCGSLCCPAGTRAHGCNGRRPRCEPIR